MSSKTLIAALCAGAALSATAFAATTFAATPMAKPDGDMQKVLDAQASLKPKPIETLTPAQARMQPSPADGAKLVIKQKGMDPNDPMGVTTKDIQVQGGDGMIPARVYIADDADKTKPLPIVVYYHGGGFVIATNDTYDASPRAIAKATKAIVIAVEYRKAPENKFPAAYDDAFAAYKWALDHGKELGGSSTVAVMGESAGGALALATSIKARDEKLPLPAREVLVYPIGGTNMATPSYTENANAKPLNKPMMMWFTKYTIKGPGDKTDPRLDAIGKADLRGLPPTTIVLAQIDPLRSDGEMLGDKLKKAGVDVHTKTYDGVTHEFFGMGAVVGKAKDAEGFVSDDLKSSLY